MYLPGQSQPQAASFAVVGRLGRRVEAAKGGKAPVQRSTSSTFSAQIIKAEKMQGWLSKLDPKPAGRRASFKASAANWKKKWFTLEGTTIGWSTVQGGVAEASFRVNSETKFSLKAENEKSTERKMLLVNYSEGERIKQLKCLASDQQTAKAWLSALQTARESVSSGGDISSNAALAANLAQASAENDTMAHLREAQQQQQALAARSRDLGTHIQASAPTSPTSFMSVKQRSSGSLVASTDLSQRRFIELTLMRQEGKELGLKLAGGAKAGVDPTEAYIFVDTVYENSFAAAADLRPGDIITHMFDTQNIRRQFLAITKDEATYLIQSMTSMNDRSCEIGIARNRSEPMKRLKAHDTPGDAKKLSSYALLDVDGDGALTKAEMVAIGMSEAIFMSIDTDHSGTIEKKEFNKWRKANPKAAKSLVLDSKLLGRVGTGSDETDSAAAASTAEVKKVPSFRTKVRLTREKAGQPLGLAIALDPSNNHILTNVVAWGIAGKLLRIGDKILEINGEDASWMTHEQVMEACRSAMQLEFEIERIGDRYAVKKKNDPYKVPDGMVKKPSSFTLFDMDGDGRVSKSELRSIGIDLDDKTFNSIDTDGNGTIEKKEFRAWKKQNPDQAAVVMKMARAKAKAKAAAAAPTALKIELDLDDFGAEGDKAASKIQAQFRGHKARKEVGKKKERKARVATEDGAASLIQANFRGHKVRKEVKQKRAQEEQAAIKIQSRVRGMQAKKEVEKKRKKNAHIRTEDGAAQLIQAQFRGHRTRKELVAVGKIKPKKPVGHTGMAPKANSPTKASPSKSGKSGKSSGVAPVKKTGTFGHFDVEGKGKLSRAEMKAMGVPGKVFKEIDADNSGFVDKAEFRAWRKANPEQARGFIGAAQRLAAKIAAAPPLEADPSGKPPSIFQMIDADGSGSLDMDEMLGLGMSEKLFKKIDTDKSGTIDKKEFRTWRLENPVAAGKIAVAAKKVFAEARAAAAASPVRATPSPVKAPSPAKASSPKRQSPPKRPSAFSIVDMNGDGRVSRFEMRTLGMDDATFSSIDTDGNGTIEKKEFRAWKKQNPAQAAVLMQLAAAKSQ